MDDSSGREEVSDPADSHIQEDNDGSVQWSYEDHMKKNRKKIKEIVISLKKKVPPFILPLKINGVDIDRVTISKHLGIDNELLDYYMGVIRCAQQGQLA